MLAVSRTATALRLPYSAGTGTVQAQKPGAENQKSAQAATGSSAAQTLTEDQLKQVETLKKRDTEVRAHEAAHQAAAGGLVRGGASFSYQRGPDGQQYAIGGEVNIDTSPVSGDPQATLRKAEMIARAALAPAEPSGQDRQVAAQAQQMAANARAELLAQQGQQKTNRFKEVEVHDRERPAMVDAYA
jgi:hypothetical protein